MGRHHLVQACEEAVPQCELSDGGLQVVYHGASLASSEPALGRQLLQHVDQDLSLALREATATRLRCIQLLNLFVCLVFLVHFNYNWVFI